MRIAAFLIFLLCSGFAVRGQSVDSLRMLLQQSTLADSTRTLVLADLAYEVRRVHPDSSMMLAQQALDLSTRLAFEKGKGRALRLIGINYYLKTDNVQALSYYRQALASSEKARDHRNIAACNNNIGNIYHAQSKYDEALGYFNAALELRRQIGDRAGEAQCYGNIGSVYHDRGDFDKALGYYSKSMEICRQIDNKDGIASCYNNIGSAYKGQGRYDKALEYFLLALRTYEGKSDKLAMAFSHNNIGNVYRDQGNYPKALESFFNALKIHEAVNSKQGIAATYTHIGNIYKDQGEFDKALAYLNNSLSIKNEIGEKRAIANTYSDIGSVYKALHNYTAARERYLNALAIREEIGDKRGIVLACVSLADIFISTRTFEQALPYLERGLATAQETQSDELTASLYAGYARYFNTLAQPARAYPYAQQALTLARSIGNVEQARNAAEQKYMAASALGKYKEAFESHALFITLRDSIQNQANIREALSKEFAFRQEKAAIEQEKRELEFESSKERQKRIAYLLGIIAVTGVIISIMVYRNNRQKQKANLLLTGQKKQIEEANEELERLNAVKNRLLSIISHDVRGPLNSLKGVLHLLEQNALSPTEMPEVISNVGHQVGQVSYFLDNLLRWTKSQLEQVKPNPQKLSLQFIVDETIQLFAFNARSKQILISASVPEHTQIYADEEMMKIVIRNLVSNAIKFCKENDRIWIRAHHEENMVRVSVEDTGRGISRETLPGLFAISHLSTKGTHEEIGTGLGLTLCKEFVERSGGTISVTSTVGEGSRFEFTVPCV